ncbi:MAG TPA: helix-turn-helix transcriptional regulator [Rubrobacter sp.]|nr:helix-turn-helix transcriptional regulator [Rubrobacter sp.]
MVPPTTGPGPEAAVRRGQPGGKLTRREREVALLVARGLTNRQIASELTISERTVTTHVDRILRKLGVTSRSRIAAWAVWQLLSEESPA